MQRAVAGTIPADAKSTARIRSARAVDEKKGFPQEALGSTDAC